MTYPGKGKGPGEGATVTDLTTRAANDDELRRRAAEGDSDALAELNRRNIERRTMVAAA